MLKLLATASLFFAFTFGVTAMAVAQAIPPPSPPSTSYELPGVAGGFREGRSIYRIEGSSTFYGGSDERGYPSGEPENPRTGD
jgi:hypothetical protein